MNKKSGWLIGLAALVALLPATASYALDLPLVKARARVIIDNDFSGDPDDLIALSHHLMSKSVDIPLIIGSHLAKGDGFDPSETQATNAVAKVNELLGVMGEDGKYTVVRGAEQAITADNPTPDSPAVDAIINEANRADTDTPLYYVAGGGLTDLALALQKDPGIAAKMTLIWIGGPEYEDLADAPPGSTGVEYNLNIDLAAAQYVFNQSDIAIWQVPRNAYRQVLMSYAELVTRVRPEGKLGGYLADNIEHIMDLVNQYSGSIGETYIMGDSPLVTLTALQSSFQPDPTSSFYATRPVPIITDDGTYEDQEDGRDIRVYDRIDTRITFEDFFAKLQLQAADE